MRKLAAIALISLSLLSGASFAAATVVTVYSSTADGPYTTGQVIPVIVRFSEAVNVTGNPLLALETGAIDQNASYSSNDGAGNLTFNYTVVAGDTSPDLDYVATNSLSLGAGGAINDSREDPATLTLAATGAAGSLGASNALVIDTTAPTAPTPITPADGSVTNETSPTLTWEASTDTGGSGVVSYEVFAPGGIVATQGATTSYPTSGLADQSHTWLLRAKDAAGNWSSYSAIVSFEVDSTPPTVLNVTSTKTNGTYTVGEIIPVTIQFSSTVNVTGAPSLELETGSTNRFANYSSGSGSDTLTLYYTVEAGDTSADLDYVATTSLTLNGGTIRDGASNNATLTLAAAGAAGNLGVNKALVIDTTNPTAPTLITLANASVTNETSPTLTWEASTDIGGSGVVSYEVNFDAVVATQAATSYPTGALADGIHAWQVRAKDAAGNWSIFSSVFSFEVDTAAPVVGSITLRDLTTTSTVYAQAVSISLEANNVTGSPTQMIISESSTFAGDSWASYSITSAFTLSAGDGLKTVYYKVRDAAQNVSATKEGTITLDTTGPSTPTLITPTDGSSTNDATPLLTWEASTDSGSGVVSYEITVDTAVATQGATTTYTPGTLADGAHTWKVRAKNGAGIWGSFPTASTITVDTVGPAVGSITLRDLTTTSTVYAQSINISLEANSVTGSPTQMMSSESSTFAGGSWTGYSSTGYFTLSAGDGLKTVYYKVRDAALNVSATVEGTITLDTTGPSIPSLVTPANASTTSDATPLLTWEASTDTGGSGVASYEITVDTTVATQGATTTYTTGTLADGAHTWGVRAKDVAGNFGSSSTRTFTVDTATTTTTTTTASTTTITTTTTTTTTTTLINKVTVPSIITKKGAVLNLPLNISSIKAGSYQLVIYSVDTGSPVKSQPLSLAKGSNVFSIQLDTGTLPGVYYISIVDLSIGKEIMGAFITVTSLQ